MRLCPTKSQGSHLPVLEPCPSHKPFLCPCARSTMQGNSSNAKPPWGVGNAKALVAGGSLVARDTCLPSHPALLSHLCDVTGIFYLLSTPISRLQDQQQLFPWLLGQERFWYTAERRQDQQMTQLQLQPTVPLLILVLLWCSCSQMEQFLSVKLQLALLLL